MMFIVLQAIAPLPVVVLYCSKKKIAAPRGTLKILIFRGPGSPGADNGDGDGGSAAAAAERFCANHRSCRAASSEGAGPRRPNAFKSMSMYSLVM